MTAGRLIAFTAPAVTAIRAYAVFIVAAIAVILAACVPQGDFLRLEAEYENELKWEKARCSEQSRRSQAEIAALRKAVEDAIQTKENEGRQTAEKYRKQLVKAQKAVNDLEKRNNRLKKRLEELRDDLEKRQSIISLQNKVIRTLDDTKKTIETSLKTEIAAQGIELEEMEGRLKLKFVDRILFDSGKVDLTKSGRKLLLTFAESVLDENSQLIQVRGFTDNTPIGPLLKESFPSNWELSAARALAVVHFLQDEGRLTPSRLSACALGPYRPIADNTTESGRRQNRRIEIIIYPSGSPLAVPEGKITPKQ